MGTSLWAAAASFGICGGATVFSADCLAATSALAVVSGFVEVDVFAGAVAGAWAATLDWIVAAAFAFAGTVGACAVAVAVVAVLEAVFAVGACAFGATLDAAGIVFGAGAGAGAAAGLAWAGLAWATTGASAGRLAMWSK